MKRLLRHFRTGADNEMARYIGVDLHTNCLTVCSMTKQGAQQFRDYKLTELEQFRAGLRRSDEVAVEATGNTRFFYEQVAHRVRRVAVVNPRQFEVIKRSAAKTDKRDAANLALFLAKGLLPEVRMKEREQAQVASLVQTRDKLVKQRTALINKLHALAVAKGQPLRKEACASEVGLRRVLAQKWDGVEQVEVEVIIIQVRSLNAGIKRLDEEIKTRGRQLAGHDSLVSIKGIGAKSATILLTVIGDINDFESEAKRASYFGIVPSVRQSNETLHAGRITKAGSKLGRTTLVQCTLVALRYSPYLKKFYDRLKARAGAGKAIIATARKLLGIIYRTLKHKWVFADFPNFVLAEP